MADKWGPSSYPIRKPTDTKTSIGKIENPPRTLKIGGVGEAKLLNVEKKQMGTTKRRGDGPVSDRGKGR